MEHRAILTPYPSAAEGKATTQMGVLILNADDWGRDEETTGRILDCLLCGALSSTSAMVYMEDSERAAAIARERNLDAGLHLNFTTPLTAPGCPERLVNHHQRVSSFLSRNRLAQAVYNPGLADSFEYLVKRQLEEFARLYGAEPERIDGHHHMHLCANVLLASLLPAGTIVRRSFSFSPGEKSWGNRLYRRGIDRILARRHRVGDFFFSLPPLEPASRLAGIFSAARQSVVEVETHPVCPAEYRFLTGGELFRWTEDLPIATRYAVRGRFPLSE